MVAFYHAVQCLWGCGDLQRCRCHGNTVRICIYTLKKCFDRVGKTDYQGKLCWRVLYEEWITLSETSRDEDGTKFKPVSGY